MRSWYACRAGAPGRGKGYSASWQGAIGRPGRDCEVPLFPIYGRAAGGRGKRSRLASAQAGKSSARQAGSLGERLGGSLRQMRLRGKCHRLTNTKVSPAAGLLAAARRPPFSPPPALRLFYHVGLLPSQYQPLSASPRAAGGRSVVVSLTRPPPGNGWRIGVDSRTVPVGLGPAPRCRRGEDSMQAIFKRGQPGYAPVAAAELVEWSDRHNGTAQSGTGESGPATAVVSARAALLRRHARRARGFAAARCAASPRATACGSPLTPASCLRRGGSTRGFRCSRRQQQVAAPRARTTPVHEAPGSCWRQALTLAAARLRARARDRDRRRAAALTLLPPLSIPQRCQTRSCPCMA